MDGQVRIYRETIGVKDQNRSMSILSKNYESQSILCAVEPPTKVAIAKIANCCLWCHYLGAFVQCQSATSVSWCLAALHRMEFSAETEGVSASCRITTATRRGVRI